MLRLGALRVKKASTTAQLRSTEFLTIQALADDAAFWREETARYRELALAAVAAVATLTRERDRARVSTQQLREEIRRYTRSACES